jgi:hypothetical protein
MVPAPPSRPGRRVSFVNEDAAFRFPPLEDDEVRRCADHLSYEISMLAQLPVLVAEFEREGPVILKIACLESLLVHARTLIEFIVGRQRPRDITPSMFLWEPSDTRAFDEYLRLIDKNLAHLSRERASLPTSPAWPVNEMVDKILEALRPFVDTLKKVGSPYATLIEQAMDRGDGDRSVDGAPLVSATSSPNADAVVSPAWETPDKADEGTP